MLISLLFLLTSNSTQLLKLDEVFQENPKPTLKEREALVTKLNEPGTGMATASTTDAPAGVTVGESAAPAAAVAEPANPKASLDSINNWFQRERKKKARE